MPFAFNLMLDPAASLEIERIYAQLGALKVADDDLVTQYGPCVTLLIVGDRVSPRIVANILEWKLPTLEAVPVTLKDPCVIAGSPPTLSLRVSPTEQLLAVHGSIFSELPEGEVHLHYRPAYWQPHLKLSNLHGGPTAAAAIIAGISEKLRPLNAVLDRLEVMQYPPAQSFWQAPLKAAPNEAPRHGSK